MGFKPLVVRHRDDCADHINKVERMLENSDDMDSARYALLVEQLAVMNKLYGILEARISLL